ncbi:MAG: hypothetical protein CL853_02580, partial [Crocinitomicaceae bacterium]|nr:hypothetical protein [Crocinitomicaceae bacterium]
MQNPVHTYAAMGTYTVSLTASNAGGSDQETKVNYITVTSGDFTWTGNAGDGDWTNGGNWDAGATPTSSDNCIIPAGAPADIQNGGSCNDLTIDAGADFTHTSGTISVSGNFTDNGSTGQIDDVLDITGNATVLRAFVVEANGEVRVGGNITLNSGGYTTTNNGLIDVEGDFDASGGVIAQGAAGDIQITGTITSLGTLDELEGTVTIEGAVVPYDTYYNLVLSTSGLTAHAGNGTTNINGSLTVSSGCTYRMGDVTDIAGAFTVDGTAAIGATTLAVDGASDINGSLTISTGTADVNGSFDATGGTVSFTDAGNLNLGSTVTSLGTFTESTSNVIYDQTGGFTQNVDDVDYYNLTLNSTPAYFTTGGTITATGEVEVGGSSTILLGGDLIAGSLDIDGVLQTVSNDVTVSGVSDIDGTLNIAGSSTYNADGDFDATNGTIESNASGSLVLSSTVTSIGALDAAEGIVKYDGILAQNVVAPSSGGYYNLTIENASTKTATGTIDVNGDLTTEAEASCVFDLGSNSLNLAGDLTVGQEGGLDASDAGCTVTFDGTTAFSHAGSQGLVSSSSTVTQTIVEGNNLTQSLPINPYYDYGWSTGIYLASEITDAADVTSINKLYVWVEVAAAGPTNDVSIWMKNIGATDAYDGTTGPQGFSTTGFTEVFDNGTLDLTTVGWYEIDITDFPYTGSGNIEILWENRDGSYNGDGSHRFGYLVTQEDRGKYCRMDNSFPTEYVNGGLVYGGYGSFVCDMKFNVTKTTSVISSINPTFNEVEIAGSGVTLSSPMDITADLTFTSGHITSESDVDGNNSQTYASTNTLTIKDGANHSGASASSHVVGAVRIESSGTSEIEFPTGDGTYYRPVFLTPSASTATTYTAEYVNSSHSSIAYDGNGYNNTPCDGDIDHVAMGCWWDIEKSSGGSAAKVGINWDSNSGVDVPDDILLTHWNSSTSQWDKINAAVTAGNGSGSASASDGRVQSNIAQTDFSPFNLGSGSGNNSLPVDLLSFHTVCSHDIVDVNFSVVS